MIFDVQKIIDDVVSRKSITVIEKNVNVEMLIYFILIEIGINVITVILMLKF